MDRIADANILQGEDQCLLLPHSQHSLNTHNVLMTLPRMKRMGRRLSDKYFVIYCHYPKWGEGVGWWQEVSLQ